MDADPFTRRPDGASIGRSGSRGPQGHDRPTDRRRDERKGTVVRPIDVLIADDDATFADVLTLALETNPGFRVLGVAADATSAIEMTLERAPDVILLDVVMPGGGGIRVARELGALRPEVRIVALSGLEDRRVVLDMLRAGAVGYVVKGSSLDEVLRTVREASRGGAALSGRVAAGVVQELSERLGERNREEGRLEQIGSRVRRVLEGSRLDVVFQPIFDLRRGHTEWVEALARFLVDPRQPPDAWFADAEAVGMRTALEATAVRRAVAQIGRLPAGASLSVNISPSAIASLEIAEALSAAPAERLVLEVTEHHPVADYDALAAAIGPLRARGARLAIDDVGAGFASLRHILLLAPDVIKLDVSLVNGIERDAVRRALARSLISFAVEIGSTIVAEGIETRATLDALRELGVTHGQGYFLARPYAPGEAPKVTVHLDDRSETNA